MKLLARYNRVNIIATIIVLLLSGLCYYFIIRNVLLNQLDEDLKVEEQEILDYVRKNDSLPNPSNYKDQEVSFSLNADKPVRRTFKSVVFFKKEENEYTWNRQILFPIKVNNKNFTVTISKSEEETEDLIQVILLITLAIVLLLLFVLFLINRLLLSKLWKPFNSTLRELTQFNLSNKNQVTLEQSRINEFRELNQAVRIMTDRVKQDYDTLKNFTENASHEMQTPLAIINSKLDVLIQDETISEFQVQQLQGIYNALDRLSALNQSLLLLTKIENNQFVGSDNIALDTLVKEKLTQFEELLESKKINVTTQLEKTTIYCNNQLADILINNLLNNAIRYNKPNGLISISISGNTLQIANSSFLPALDNQKLFQRFYRHGDTKQDGNGLGLSIVKQICDRMGFLIDYKFMDDKHFFTLHF
jgi:signal transduction histidine kinase